MKNTTLCYLQQDGCYLMLHRTKKKNDENEGKWIGVGGKMEEGESPDECVCREVLEETGLQIFAPRLCGIKDWIEEDGTRYVVHLYQTNQFDGNVISSKEGKTFWLPLGDLPQQKLASGMELMLRVFCEDSLSEMFFCKKNGAWETLLKSRIQSSWKTPTSVT